MLGKDKYSVIVSNSVIDNYQQVIISLYMPMIGSKATNLYFLLINEFIGSSLQLERLCRVMDLNIDELQQAVIKLEEYGLIKTYYKVDNYLFIINSPLNPDAFFNHSLYSRILLRRVGSEEFSLLKSRFTSSYLTDDYEDITHQLDAAFIKNWDANDEEVYQKVNRFDKYENIIIDFDYETFIRNNSDLKFPVSQRTESNMKTIGQLATIFAISANDMVTHVARSIDKKTKVLNLEDLRNRCLKEKNIEIKSDGNDINCNPVEYLYSKFNVPVPSADKKILEYLQTDLKLKNDVINYLIDYVLETSNNQFKSSYVEKIATSWARLNVDSIEKAKQAIENSTSKPRKEKTVYEVEEMKVEELDIDALRKQLFSSERN